MSGVAAAGEQMPGPGNQEWLALPAPRAPGSPGALGQAGGLCQARHTGETRLPRRGGSFPPGLISNDTRGPGGHGPGAGGA
jgi:hypothetical protein